MQYGSFIEYASQGTDIKNSWEGGEDGAALPKVWGTGNFENFKIYKKTELCTTKVQRKPAVHSGTSIIGLGNCHIIHEDKHKRPNNFQPESHVKQCRENGHIARLCDIKGSNNLQI